MDIQHIRISPFENSYNGVLVTKATLHRQTPYDHSLFIDGDTIISEAVEPLFSALESHPLVLTQFSKWTVNHPDTAKRLGDWFGLTEKIDQLLQFVLNRNDPVINTGVFGFRKGFECLEDWCNLAIAGIQKPVPDEIAMQLIVSQLKDTEYRLFDDSWNFSPRYGSCGNPVRIWHFHSGLHTESPQGRMVWRPWLESAVRENVANIKEWGPACDNAVAKLVHQ